MLHISCIFQAKKFLTTHPLGTGKLAGKQSLAAIQNHIDWLEKNEKNVIAWLKKKTEKAWIWKIHFSYFCFILFFVKTNVSNCLFQAIWLARANQSEW